ncbi:MAG: hypothetical protein F6K45_04320 [Kamptonema sp. SIO1D9]|nr:hypothetical protein [Kamptonema sp. SIO1D9]
MKILDYLLSKNPREFDYQYKQNAFLALTYLLTFSEDDNSFCQIDSLERKKAQQVIEIFNDERIILVQVSREISLNQHFQQLIEGTAQEDDVENLIQAG